MNQISKYGVRQDIIHFLFKFRTENIKKVSGKKTVVNYTFSSYELVIQL